MKLTVGVVNWNGKRYLRECLEHVLVQEGFPFSICLFIFDNASSDGSLEDVRDILNTYHIEVITSENNIGFAAAHNKIISRVTSDYYMPLNFDVFLEPNYIRNILIEMDKNDRIGMATGKLRKMVNFTPQMVLDSTGIEMPYYWPRARGEMEHDVGQYDSFACRIIFGPCGAAPVYRVKMLEDIRFENDYFDEHFVNYVEDVDLAWRAQLRGWKGIYVPSAIAYHERGATRKDDVNEKQQYILRGYRNRYLTMYKNMTSKEIISYGWKVILKEMLFLISSRDGGSSRMNKIKALINAHKIIDYIKPKRNFIQNNIIIDLNIDYLNNFTFKEFSLIIFIVGKIFNVMKTVSYKLFYRIYHSSLKGLYLSIKLVVMLKKVLKKNSVY